MCFRFWAIGARTAASGSVATPSRCRSTTCRTRPARRWPTISKASSRSRTATAGCSSARTETPFPHPDRHGHQPERRRGGVVGTEPGWTKRIVDGIRASGKPVEGFAIEGNGDLQTIAAASRRAEEFLKEAGEAQRERCNADDLWVAVKCGESDTTSGLAANPTVGNFIDKVDAVDMTTCFGETSELTGSEQVCASRAATRQVREKFLNTWSDYNDLILKNKTSDLSDSQPTKGNIAGGLTTVEGKAVGNLEKIGRKAKFVDVLADRETPAEGPGLYFMNTSAAAGFAVHLFPTGQGNVIGNPIVPVIKRTGNLRTVRPMSEHIDLDVSAILRGQMNFDKAGGALIDITPWVANGRLTCAESFGHRSSEICH